MADYSLPAPVVVNPLAAMQGAAQTAGSIYDVRKAQATEALGDAYRGAIDQQTGVLDPNKFRSLAAQDPRTAMAIGPGLANIQTISSDELKQRFAKLDAWRAENGALADMENPTYADVLGGVQRLVAAGTMTPAEAQAYLSTVPHDSAAIKQLARQHNLVLADTSRRMDETYGKPITVEQGGQVIGGRQRSAAQGGALSTSGQGVQKGIDPSKLNEPMRFIDKNTGQWRDGTYGEFLENRGIDPKTVYVGPQTGGGVAGNAPGGPGAVIPGTGRRPPAALTNPNKPAVAPTAPAETPAGGTPPATTTAAPSPLGTPVSVLSDDDRKTVNDHIAQGDAAQPRLAILGNMKADTANFVTGTAAERTLDWKRAAQSFAPGFAKALGVESVNISSQEDFQKNVAQLLQAQNAQSDKKLDVGVAATPSAHLSPEGVQMILTKLQGNDDYLRARAQLARSFLRNPANMQDYQDNLAKLDPRAFQYKRMNATQRGEYKKSLSKDAWNEVLASGKAAQDLGVLQ